VKLLKRLWLSLRGGTVYEELEQKGHWATWQVPDEAERQDCQLDEHRD